MLDPQVSPEEIKSREVELGLRVGLLSLQLFPSGGATDIVFVTRFCIAVGTATGVVRRSLHNAGRTFCCSGGGSTAALAFFPCFTLLSPLFSRSSPSLIGLFASVDV